MAKKLLLVAALLVKLCFAQGNIYNDIAIGNAGIPGATVRVCSQSAAGSIGSCSPLATVYTDATLATACDGVSTTCSNPLTADSRGNYSFYAAPGRYIIDISSIGFNPYRQTVAVAIDPNASVNFGSYMKLGVIPFVNLNPAAVDGTIVGVSGAAATSPCSAGTATLVARHESGQWNCSGSAGGTGGGNSVVAVTASAPLNSTGGANPNIGVNAASPGQSIIGPCGYAGSPTTPTIRTLCVQDVPPTVIQGADNVLFSGPSDANGNPNFLGTTAGLAVLVNPTGLPTPGPLTSFISGRFQSIAANSNFSVTVPATPTGEFFVLQNQNLSSDGTVLLSDMVATNIAPQWSYPPAPTCDPNASATWTDATHKGPHFWFNMASQTMFRCTVAANGFSVSPAAMLGVCDDSGTAVDKCISEPYGLTPGRRFFLFGDGSSGPLALTAGTTTQDGAFSYRSCFLTGGATLKGSNPTVLLNTPGLLVYCQTPLLVMGNSTIGTTGGGRVGSGGGTGVCVAAQNGGMGASGGGSGGAATTNTVGCAGGGMIPFWSPQTTSLVAGGTAGTFGGAAAGAGKDVTVGWVGAGQNPFAHDVAGSFLFGFGAPGAAGSGNGTLASGAGGSGGSFNLIKAPSVLIDSGSFVRCDGGAGGNSGNASGGGGGGGGGWCIVYGGFSANGATGITAAPGAGGTSGTGQAGAAGGTGIALFVRAF